MHTPMISYIRKEYINNKCTHQWYLILEKNTSTTNAHTNDITPMISYIRKEYIFEQQQMHAHTNDILY